MDNENVLHGKESLVDYTQLGTIDSSVLDEWQHLAGTMRETTHEIVQHPGSFQIHLPHYLAWMARGFRGTTILVVCLPRLLLSCRSPFLPLPAASRVPLFNDA